MSRWLNTVAAFGFASVLLDAVDLRAQTGCSPCFPCDVRVEFAGARDRVTIAPQGGESLADVGITIRVIMRSCSQGPIVGVPASNFYLYSPSLALCPGGNYADGPTDSNGETTFTGTIRGGGCAENLQVFVGGMHAGTVAVKTNSADTVDATPGSVDAGDLAALAMRLGNPAHYSICLDLNESGPPTIDAGDLAAFASVLGTNCQLAALSAPGR